MSGIAKWKSATIKARQHKLALNVRRQLKALNYVGIQVTSYEDALGCRLVPHDFIAYGVYVLVRACGSVLTGTELAFIAEHNAYVQLGASDIRGLRVYLDAARASATINTVRHWSTVGNSD